MLKVGFVFVNYCNDYYTVVCICVCMCICIIVVLMVTFIVDINGLNVSICLLGLF